ncbi:alginate lyase family protein [Paenibacillus ginsengarvi]|uniref:Alginate lyase n=1 Tax=Paenibacillus ginsengarvi TaxID=400777 RepID=A0A3B0CIG6_9BACL|nr:alginate lyase family protein [Paenibacillus ginsengarvi]RKN84087.1 alginate lyase [Paenibacillus ginsengarvi]
MLTDEKLAKWQIDRHELVAKADRSLDARPISITDTAAERSAGGRNDYYSNGDYWWPNPETPDGLPFVKRDGESYPEAFFAHREALRSMRTHVANLAAGYAATGLRVYADKAAALLRTFFLDEKTRMNPHLLYAQAVPGLCEGRGIGIIDTLHLIDIPAAVEAIEPSGAITEAEAKKLRGWFADYLNWMCTHPYGIEERDTENNHAVCWHVQAAAFALFTGNEAVLAQCRERYKTVLLPRQMAPDGSFPLELARTKPYGYSIFVLDNTVTLCRLLSVPADYLWEFRLEDGRGIRLGLDYLYPYLADKSSWPHGPDVEHFDGWPVRMSFMLFAGTAFGDERYMRLWNELPADSADPEIRRNMALRQPVLWLMRE